MEKIYKCENDTGQHQRNLFISVYIQPSTRQHFQNSRRFLKNFESKMPINYSFAGKSVLVTGGASGMGRQLVQRLSEDGATVFTVDKDAKGVQKLQNDFPNVTAEIVDLADWKATQAVVESFGKIDHLVNNAGMIIQQSFLDITEEAANLQYKVLTEAIISVSQVVAKGMIASGKGGSIVTISSAAAKKSFPGTACYSAAKAAVVSLTKSMAVELGAHGIRANCILPGFVDTPLSQSHLDEQAELHKQILEKMIGKRPITTNEIADLVLFLLSPLSGMITGEDILIDGGLMLF